MSQSIDSAVNLVAQLRHLKLLPANLLDDLARGLHVGTLAGDPRILAGHLLRQGWLTPFQINLLFCGRGGELVIGPYVVLERLGEGGAGQVFKARHQRMQRTVALKIIRKELLSDADTVARFRREIEVVSQLDHLNVVHAYDAGPAGGIFFLAMEYIEGIDLARLIKQSGPLTVAQACDYLRQAATGLQHAHERGLVHRDIKPPNFLVSPAPGSKKTPPGKTKDSSLNGSALAPWGVVKLLDLGLARLQRKVDGDRTNFLTAAGPLMMGTPDFMAPEQALDFHDVDIRSDIYSLGCTFYFLVTGEPPFPGGTLAQKLMRHQQVEPPPLQQHRADFPAPLNAVVQRMLAKRPAERFQTPAEVVQALGPFVRGGTRPGNLPVHAHGTTAVRTRSATAAAIALPPLNGAALVRRPGATIWQKLRTPLTAWFWRRRLLICASAASLFVLALFALTGTWWLLGGSSTSTAVQASQAHRHLDKLRAELAGTEPALQRHKLLEFRRSCPGTPAALEATQWLMQLPSSLDALDDSLIPPDKRLPWQPKELVAVLGEANTSLRMATLAVQPRGPLLATRGTDNSIQVWHPITGKIHATIKTNNSFIMGAALAPDGQTLALSVADRSVSVWDLSNGQERTTPQSKPLLVIHMAYAPNGKTLATATADSTVKLWDVTTAPIRELTTLGALGGSAVTCMTFSADSQTLATVGGDRTVRLWDVAAAKEKLAFTTGTLATVALVFAPHGKTLAGLGSSDGKVRLWDTATGKETAAISKNSFALQWLRFGAAESNASMMFSPDGQLLALGGVDKNLNNNRPTILLWDVANNRERATLQRLPDMNSSYFFLLEFDAQLQSLTTWGLDQTLRLWDIPAGRERAVIKGYNGRINALALSPSGDTLVTASTDGSAKLWDAATAKVRGQLRGHSLAVTALAYAPDGQSLATGGYDRTVKLWDVAAKVEQATVPIAKGFPTALAYSPDGRTLAIGTSERRVIFWDVPGGKERAGLQDSGSGWITALTYSPDGQTLAVIGEDGRCQLWKPGETPKRNELPGTGGRGESLAFSPAGGHLALGGDGKVSIFRGQTRGDTSTWMRERTLEQRAGSIRTVQFSPDGSRLATAGEDSELVLWKGDGSVKLQQWRFSVPIQGVSFAADGRHLATLNGDGTVYVLRLAQPSAPASH